jgi:hypothetical protein
MVSAPLFEVTYSIAWYRARSSAPEQKHRASRPLVLGLKTGPPALISGLHTRLRAKPVPPTLMPAPLCSRLFNAHRV